MKVGLFFGTFNPIHVGHLIIANYMVEHSDLNQVWLVVTPQSPFKKKQSLLDDHQRLEMVYLATKDFSTLKSSDIEFRLPKPSYTINTLVHIREKYPNEMFSLIMGEDNLKGLHKWKNFEIILEDYSVYVYPRLSDGGIQSQFYKHPNIKCVNAPIMALSSTAIRDDIKAGKNVKPMLPDAVWTYLDEMNFYK